MKTCIEAQSTTSNALQRYSLNGRTMGSRYSAVFYAGAGLEQTAINRSLFAAVDAVDRQMSSWRPESDLNRLNTAPVQQWLTLPPELMQVLDCALRVSRLSEGAFDIGVGDLVNAWGFGPLNAQPDPVRIATLQTQQRYLAAEALILDMPGCQALKQAPLTLDLCGIAKGFGVDQLASCLDQWGIRDYLVGIDGELRARGRKPDDQPWSLAVEKPVRGSREVSGVLEISDSAIATSGDYRHWRDLHGQAFSHTMSSAAKSPSDSTLASVSVMQSSCMLADAWATALLAAGPQAGPEMAKTRGIDALFMLREGEELRQLWVSDGIVAAP